MHSANRLYPNNSLVNVVPALRTGAGAGAYPASKNYTEPAYMNVGAAASAVTYTVQLQLKDIINSFMAMDKMLFWPQITYLRLFFGPVNKMCYISTTNANPQDGTPTTWTPATVGNTIQIQNLQLLLAVEQNPEIRNQLQAETARGHSFIIPYTQNFKNSNSNTSQTITIQIDSGQGRSLMKIYHAVFNNNELNNTAYDCDNSDNASGGQKVVQYWSQLQGQRIQNITLDCRNYLNAPANPKSDYLQQQKNQQFKGSIMQNVDIYQYNWSHMDDFTGFSPEYQQQGQQELISGIPMQAIPFSWAFYGLIMANATFQHYSWFVFTKRLSIGGPNGGTQYVVD